MVKEKGYRKSFKCMVIYTVIGSHWFYDDSHILLPFIFFITIPAHPPAPHKAERKINNIKYCIYLYVHAHSQTYTCFVYVLLCKALCVYHVWKVLYIEGLIDWLNM